MNEPSFWRVAAERFRRLQPRPPEPGEPASPSHNGICAWWQPQGWSSTGKLYRFFNDGHDLESNRNIERLFKIEAESAGVELGHASGEEAIFAWLDGLRIFGLYVVPMGEGGHILNRLCDASAEYCIKCESDAKTKAREVNQMSQSTWQTTRQQFLAGHQKYPAFSAAWEASYQRWTFVGGTEEAEQAFRDAAATAMSLIRKSTIPEVRIRANSLGKSWQLWLDLMRDNRRGFLSVPKPSGHWRQAAKAAEHAFAFDVDPSSVIGVEVGGIPHLFKESAEFCVDLESRDIDDEGEGPDSTAPITSSTTAESPKEDDRSKSGQSAGRPHEGHGNVVPTLASQRQQMLSEYKAATNNPSNRSIYSARNSFIHKPEFYDWVSGKLPPESQTSINFERFLSEKKPPLRREGDE